MFRLSIGLRNLSLRNHCLIYFVPGHQHLQHNLQQQHHHHPQHQHPQHLQRHPQHLQRHPQHPQHPPQPTQQQPLLSKFETSLEGGYGFSIAKSSSFSSARSSGRVRECECPMCYHSAANPCTVCGCPSRDLKTRNESQGEIPTYGGSHWSDQARYSALIGWDHGLTFWCLMPTI